MTVQLELETYRHLVMYLNGLVSLREFRTWFDSNTWDQAAWESPLIGQIELALAELSSSDLTEHEFGELLRSSIPTVTLEIQPITEPGLPTVVTSTASNTTKSMPAFVVPSAPPVEGARDEPSVRTLRNLVWRPVPV
jgi:hypothetical protein